MLKQVLTGSFLIIICSLTHLGATTISINIIKKIQSWSHKRRKIHLLIWLDVIVLLLILTSLLEATIWAGFYFGLDAIDQFEKALYFSIVTFTTLGYGDIVMNTNWRILASLEAASGIIFFGWSTAIVMGAIQNIYLHKRV